MRAADALGRVDATPASFTWEIDPTLPPAGAIVVDNKADTAAPDGRCTLREAIGNANADAATWVDCVAGQGADTIVFAQALGAVTVTLGSPLPAISDTDGLTIDGGGDVEISGADAYRIFYVNRAFRSASVD